MIESLFEGDRLFSLALALLMDVASAKAFDLLASNDWTVIAASKSNAIYRNTKSTRNELVVFQVIPIVET